MCCFDTRCELVVRRCRVEKCAPERCICVRIRREKIRASCAASARDLPRKFGAEFAH
jgi:hypothetical protein